MAVYIITTEYQIITGELQKVIVWAGTDKEAAIAFFKSAKVLKNRSIDIEQWENGQEVHFDYTQVQ